MGWLVVGLLTALALVDAVGLARRSSPSDRADLGIATALFFTVLIAAPVLILGYANLLWPSTLAPASLALLVGVFWALARRPGPRALLVDCGAALRELALLPVAALREAWRERSLVFVGLVAAAAFIGISLVLTWLVEFCRWDDEIYHTPVVGWALQLHGFRIVDAPPPGVGGTNGYPKLCEGLSLWFVIFTDKTLLELPATLFAAPVMLCVYAMARRFVDRMGALTLAVVLLLAPHAWRQFCSSYVDLEMAFFLLAATYYASRAQLGFRDLLLCTVALALAAGSKTTWLLFCPPVALVAYVRLVRGCGATRRRDAAWAIAASLLCVGAVGALCLGRNWWHYQNPVWPVAYDIPSIGIHWPGIFTPEDYRGHDPSVVEGFAVPRGGMHDVMRHGYGLAVMWVGGPLGLAAIGVWVAALVRARFRRQPSDAVRAALPSMVPCIVWLAVGPNFGQPRYNLHLIAVLLVHGAWLLASPLWARLREGLFGAMLMLSLIPLFWMNDANFATLEEEKERLAHPFANRAYSLHPSFDLLEREKYDELRPGDEVVFSQGVVFPGLLWNFDFSNRVDYVEYKRTPEFLAKLTELQPTWVCVGAGSDARKAIDQTEAWTLVGRTNPALNEVAFRRRDAR